jgi:hypothetical protein
VPGLFSSLVALVSCALAAGCAARSGTPADHPRQVVAAESVFPSPPLGLRLLDSLTIPTGTAFPALDGARFGGISGCAPDRRTGTVLAVSDDHDTPRLFRLGVEFRDDRLLVTPLATHRLRDEGPLAGVLDDVDLEAIVLDGDLILLASEGNLSKVPRVPPAVLAVDATGRVFASLPLSGTVLPEPLGRQRRGVRRNRAFESLTLVPGRDWLLTATEGPLLQDAGGPTFARGALGRLFVYERDGASWRLAGGAWYPLSRVARPAGWRRLHYDSGLVELLALDTDRVLALERGFIRERAGERRARNTVALYEISIAQLASPSHGRRHVVPKRLVLSLDAFADRLDPALARLENFEALCEGPVLADGSRTLLLISDNNFSEVQTTGFVLLQLEGVPPGPVPAAPATPPAAWSPPQ